MTMSREQLEAFETAVREDAGLQGEIRELGPDVDGIVALGQREGFSFTAAEMNTYLDSFQAESGRELNDEELEAVSGGQWNTSLACPWN
jgi:predicted ribosomally synthesized peptide with nif11-like leader